MTAGVLALILLIGLPVGNAYGWITDYSLNLFSKYLALAILALGMDLIWGYTGILSLGQAIFFGLGAYAMGMYLMLESSGKGVYGEAIPDFMVWNRVTELPLYWVPFKSFPIAVIGSILVPAAAAAVIGFLTFRRRVGGTYFAILTQAIAFATWLMFNRNEMNLGGTNGLTDFKSVLGFSLSEPGTQWTLYMLTAFLLIACYVGCRWLTGSKIGCPTVLPAYRGSCGTACSACAAGRLPVRNPRLKHVNAWLNAKASTPRPAQQREARNVRIRLHYLYRWRHRIV